jgi:DNA repair exonuclease SbcCD ATPase subunit
MKKNKMKIQIKNISGIQNESVTLSEGINVIRAPNAVGKTSTINSLKVITLQERDLKTHPEFLNDSANDGFVSIDFQGVKDDRKIRRYGNELAVIGNPLLDSNGKSELLFAEPENEIIHQTTQGKSIEPFIEKFSNVHVYQKLNSDVIDPAIVDLKAYYDDDSEAISKLKSIEKELNTLKSEREKMSKERERIKPLIEKAKSQIKNSGKIEAMNKQKNEMIGDISRLSQGLKGKEKEKPLLEKELNEAEKRKTEHLKNKGKLQTEVESLSKEKGKYESMQEDLEKDVSKLDDNIATLEQVSRNVDWASTKDCPVCGRPITSSVKNAWQKHLESERKQINSELLKTENKIKEIDNRINDIEDELDELNDINKSITEMNGRLATLEKELKNDKKDVEAKSELVNKLKKEIEELEKQIDPSLLKIWRQQGILDEDIGETDGKIKGLNKEHEEVSEKEKGLSVLKRKIEFIQKVKESIKNKITEMKDGVKNKFNARIKEVYPLLNFKNFDEVFINNSYKIEVVRRGKQQELNRLSTSERVTLGVLVMLAGKEEYLPDFPFFVLDEVTTAYDPVRFKKIIDYISQKTKTKYVIVTAFSPTGDKIKIEKSI